MGNILIIVQCDVYILFAYFLIENSNNIDLKIIRNQNKQLYISDLLRIDWNIL